MIWAILGQLGPWEHFGLYVDLGFLGILKKCHVLACPGMSFHV